MLLSLIVHRFRGIYTRQRFLLWLALSLAALAIGRGIGTGEFAINHDEAFQACTGLYFASFIHDLPLRHPIAYTYLYYAHYPALQLVTYPPVFYVAEGLGFLILGPSVITARITVLLFALLGLYFWFRLVVELQDEVTAGITTVLVAFLPSVLFFEKAVMLEIPAMAFCVAAGYYWVRYLREGARRLVYYFAVFAALALLTKVQTAYLATWCVLSVIVTGKWRAVLNRWTSLALLLSAVVVLPYYAFSFALAGRALLLEATKPIPFEPLSFASAGALFRADFLEHSHAMAYSSLFYLITLPGQVGWVILGLAVLSLMWIKNWEKPENAALILTWIVACYITETVIPEKQPRYIIYWLPPIVYLAVAPVVSMLRWQGWTPKIAAASTLLTVLVCYSMMAWSYRWPYVSGYAELARRLVREPGGYVLIDTPWEGEFVFFARAFDPLRRFVIDPKALYIVRQVKAHGYLELAHSTDDVRKIIREGGFRYIIVDTKMRRSFESQRFLRDVLNDPEFKPLYRVQVDSNISELRGDTLTLYEDMQARPPADGTYRLRMLTLSHDISVPRTALNLGGQN